MLKSKPHFEQKDGTKTVSFRIPDHVVAELKSDAARLNVSPSTMPNNVLRRWLDWDRYAEKLDLILVPKKLLSEIVLGSDVDQIHGLPSTRSNNVYLYGMLISQANGGQYGIYHPQDFVANQLNLQ